MGALFGMRSGPSSAAINVQNDYAKVQQQIAANQAAAQQSAMQAQMQQQMQQTNAYQQSMMQQIADQQKTYQQQTAAKPAQANATVPQQNIGGYFMGAGGGNPSYNYLSNDSSSLRSTFLGV